MFAVTDGRIAPDSVASYSAKVSAHGPAKAEKFIGLQAHVMILLTQDRWPQPLLRGFASTAEMLENI